MSLFAIGALIEKMSYRYTFRMYCNCRIYDTEFILREMANVFKYAPQGFVFNGKVAVSNGKFGNGAILNENDLEPIIRRLRWCRLILVKLVHICYDSRTITVYSIFKDQVVSTTRLGEFKRELEPLSDEEEEFRNERYQVHFREWIHSTIRGHLSDDNYRLDVTIREKPVIAQEKAVECAGYRACGCESCAELF